MKRLFLAILILRISAVVVSGNEFYTLKTPDPLYETWRWKTIPEISNSGIRCLTEGKDHSWWFGTGQGLFHYDGTNWQQYTRENEILSAPIYGLCYTGDDELYVVSERGIAHRDPQGWHTDLIFPDTGLLGNEWEILNIKETRDRDIWVGLYFGLLKIRKDQVTLYTTHEQLNGIEEYFDHVSVKYMEGVYEDIEPFIVFDVIEDKMSTLWFGLEDGRVLHLNSANQDPSEPSDYRIYGAADNMLISRLPILYESSKGDIYCISQSIRGGINKWDRLNDTWIATALNKDFGGDNLNFSICESADGTLWVGSLSRLFSLRDTLWTEYKQPRVQIPPTRIIVKSSSDGALWIVGHLGDVVRVEYATPQWQTYNDLLYQCETADGSRWFLNSQGEVIVHQTETDFWSILGDEFPLSDPVRLFVDNSSCLWALGSHDTVASLAWNTEGIWQIKTFPELCWSFHPNGVFQTHDDAIWFGANADCGDASWGIVRFDPQGGYTGDDKYWTHYKGNEVCEVAYALSETDDNTLLCGYYKGLFEFNGTQTTDLHHKLIGDIIKIESMVPDPVSGVWIGTRSQGIIHYINDEKWTQFTVDDGLVSNSVSSVMIAEDSSVWVATDKGISLFDRKKWTKLALPEHFKFARGNGKISIGKDGSIWISIASIEWYRRVFYNKIFSPDESPLVTYHIKPEQYAPETRIVQFDKKVYYPGNTMIFWSGVDQWNATLPDEIQFSYRLDDEEWSEFSLQQNYQFLGLRRGKHHIQVRARDNFMNIDPTPAEIEIKVIPPLWGRVWFILLLIGVVSTIVYLFLNSIRKNREMEAQNQLMKKNNDNLRKQQEEIEQKGKQIMKLLENEREAKWLNNGVLLINEVIKQHRNNVNSLANAILVKLAEYLNISAGAIMLIHKDDLSEESAYLDMVGSYGLSGERLKEKKMHLDEGLAGACLREKKTMKINNVPESYYLESGLGKSTLTELVLIPLKLHEEVAGILEISSMQSLSPKEIELLELVTENIASNIISLQSAKKIQEMYDLSQEQTSKLHEQEEELRQQMEELQATQEESLRREQKLKDELKQLKSKIQSKKKDGK